MKEKSHYKHISEIEDIIAGDQCFLREIFHPDRDPVNLDYSLAYAYIRPGGKTVSHYLLESETYYIISGTGLMHVGEDTFDVGPGSSYVVPKETNQWLENTGEINIEFLVIVNPPWKEEHEFVAD